MFPNAVVRGATHHSNVFLNSLNGSLHVYNLYYFSNLQLNDKNQKLWL